MTTKHTKGPWVLMPKDEFGLQVVSLETYPDALDPICNLLGQNNADNNAKLIAAAPSMLFALEQSLIYFEAYGDKYAVKKILAVLKKTKGE